MASIILEGDCRSVMRQHLADGCIQTCVTSPPYFGLRDYGHAGQIGLEASPAEYVAELVEVFREVRRVLRNDGTVWLNLGDSYNNYGGNRGASKGLNKNNHAAIPQLPRGAGLMAKEYKNKDLLGIPWMVAFALRNDGWFLRQEIIWHKPNPMPESITDRCTKAHEQIFMLTKNPRYYFNAQAIAEPAIYADRNRSSATAADLNPNRKRNNRKVGASFRAITKTRNKRSVWTVPPRPFKDAHFATFPPDLIEPCILAGSQPGGLVLDPFGGAGTTGLVANRTGRDAILIELNGEYINMAERRLSNRADLK